MANKKRYLCITVHVFICYLIISALQFQQQKFVEDHNAVVTKNNIMGKKAVNFIKTVFLSLGSTGIVVLIYIVDSSRVLYLHIIQLNLF